MGWTVIKNGERGCIMCGARKPLSEFYRCSYRTKQGKERWRYESRCIPCARARRIADHQRNRDRNVAYSRAWRESNGAQGAQALREYRAANPQKVRLQRVIAEQKRRAKADLDRRESRQLIERVLEEARIGEMYLDAYTGQLIARPEIDHITAIKRGGQHDYWNLCVTSGRNNRSKNARHFLVWMAQQ